MGYLTEEVGAIALRYRSTVASRRRAPAGEDAELNAALRASAGAALTEARKVVAQLAALCKENAERTKNPVEREEKWAPKADAYKAVIEILDRRLEVCPPWR